MNYNPDVLSCLANLSNDEVFTPPAVVNQMLDLLPQELFASPKTTFLDHAAKSGVFLREITKRLIKGLENEIPDLQERVDHILHKQVFGIATTELTSLVSRRSLYCSKYPNCKYSVSKFDTVEGNIRFRALKHTFVNGRCKWCGASASQFDRDASLESHAYEFIHTSNPEEIFNMKFDVIISNPPYQLNVGVEMESYAVPIYQKFVEQAKNMNPRYLIMIIPARWYAGGRGLDAFREVMLHDKHIRHLEDFINANDVFSGVEIKGGVCYFLRDRDVVGECFVVTHTGDEVVTSSRYLLEEGNDTFIRHSQAISIINKVRSLGEKSFSSIVSPQTPFGLYSSFKGFHPINKGDEIKVYANKECGFINDPKVISKNVKWIKAWKVYVPKAIGTGDSRADQIKPIIGEPNSICTQTYIMYGPFNSKFECENVVSFVRTRFFHFLVGQKKVTQDAMSKVYQFVPLVDFSKKWSDRELYDRYNLSPSEISFLEEMTKVME